ncbi:MAG TPA: acetyl-CoA carboxylase biotin carboxyl carrier protein subunit, partial [Alkalispirochaeta sp.]|nr:acetyl-CoA carboxylase biotin carboxyl carrier protein subunit [Alkalispirochaeta sp.]
APAAGGGSSAQGGSTVTAPMPGIIIRSLVKSGDTVSAGEPVMLMESMKMEVKVEAETAGTVSQVHVTDGQNVEADAVLVTIT